MARRPFGSGTIYESSSGRWVAAVYLVSGKRLRRVRASEAEAREALAELLRRDDLGWAYVMPRPYHHGTRERLPRSGISPRVRWDILTRDGFRCVYCGATAQDERLMVDHIVPVAAGGSDDRENLATACAPCNLGKSDRSLA